MKAAIIIILMLLLLCFAGCNADTSDRYKVEKQEGTQEEATLQVNLAEAQGSAEPQQEGDS